MARMNRKYLSKYRKADSKFEVKLNEGVLCDTIFHSKEYDVSYSIPKTYQPDFIYYDPKTGVTIFIEAKGRFRDSEEARKYKYIKLALEEHNGEICGTDNRFVFLFMKPGLPMPHAKLRKSGTKMSHAEWAEKNGIEWFTEESIGCIL